MVMNEAPIQIRNPEVVRAIRTLAERTGRPMTEAVAQAVNAALDRQQTNEHDEYLRRLAAIRAASRKFRDLPVVGPRLTDDDFYDEDGMPI
jgi:hypothetical protein